MNVRIKNRNISISVDGGTIAEACAKAGHPLELVCNGQGTCGKCRVEITCCGETRSVPACKTPVTEGMEITVPETLFQRSDAVLTEGRPAHEFSLRPTVTKLCRSRQALTPADGSPAVERKLSRLLADEAVSAVTYVYSGQRLLDVQPGDTRSALYGVAVDIGTTTVVLYAYDLNTGELLDTVAALNSQIAHGGDVISRIQYAVEKPDGTDELHRLILRCINELLARVEEHHPGFVNDLWHMVLCGNSAMQHFFLGLDPSGLAAAPFTNATEHAVTGTGEEYGLVMAKAGRVDFLPLLGGFVGADTAAVLLTLPENGQRRLMVDLGTNGEIAVGLNGAFQVASTACGPALEGGCIECGMRAAPGAIRHVTVDANGVQLQTIGGSEPVGLCGSGIIDAVAELLRWAVIDPSGRMLSRAEYAGSHADSPLSDRLEYAAEHDPCFVLSRGEHTVCLTQKDVRQIQLAKSAVCSGCIALLADNGLTPQDVDALYLSGAFGSYMDIDNALAIGLLPPVPRERIVSVGNGAGQGVQMCLLDREQLSRSAALPSLTVHRELASDRQFAEEYMANMSFFEE